MSIIQRTLIVQLYLRATFNLQEHKGHSEGILEIEIIAKFNVLSTVADRQHLGRSRTVKNIDSTESVREDVTHNPQKIIERRSEEFQISKTSLWHILREDLKCYLYKI